MSFRAFPAARAVARKSSSCAFPLALATVLGGAAAAPARAEHRPQTEDPATRAPDACKPAGSGAAELETVVVTGQRRELSFDLPLTSAGVTGSQLRERVFINTEDALKNLPSVSVRKRYIGDRNGLLSGRSFNSLQAPRGVVYADGVLLSNFLGRFNAPRWNMVAPEEIARVDVLYGPYSALYPGNSIGTTVLITTREPYDFEASGRAQYFSQSFEEYGREEDFGGTQLSALMGGSRGAWFASLGVNRLDSDGHPMQYATGRRLSAPTPEQLAAAVDVTGAIADRDPKGLPRLILGPDGGSMEDDTQNQVKLRLGYRGELFEADGLFGYWSNRFDRRGDSFLRDAGGNPVTRGTIRFEDEIYTVADSAFGRQEGQENHLLTAATLRTHRASGWNVSAVVSRYDILDDTVRANVPTGAGASENLSAGTITDGGSGEGWWNADIQARHDRLARDHDAVFGYYHSRYEMDQRRFSTTDWRSAGRESLVERSAGVTRVQALYLQDTWRLAPNGSATAGLRGERWEAFDGLRANADAPDGLDFPRRTEEDLSPKFSLSWAPADWSLRYSIGRGVRYPTVAELFQGSIGTTTVGGQPVATIVNNDPDLKPEDALSQELAFEILLAARHRLRASLFRDDVDDTINFQSNVNVTPTVTNLQNVDRVLTQGLELVYSARDALPSLNVEANLTLRDSTIEENANNPASEGKDWVRLPKVQANLVLDWRFVPGWNLNLTTWHLGKTHGELDNSDEAGCKRFGCAPGQTTLDVRLGHTAWDDRLTLGLGVQNLTDERYYEFHPFPQRTLVAELRIAL